MFPVNIPIRETFEARSQVRRASMLSGSNLTPSYYPTDLLKKIETKKSYTSDSMKTSSILNDDNYNTFIYEWRKLQEAPIVNMMQIAKISQIHLPTGLSCTHNTIKPEPIQCILSGFNQFSKQQLLLIFKNMLDGHQAIFKKLRATSVSLQKSVITIRGQIKVWVNQHLQRNDISGEILNKEEDIVKRIFQTMVFLINNNGNILNDFIQYVNSAMKRNGTWTFSYLRALIRSYSDCLRIKVPKTLLKFDKQNQNRIYNENKKFIQNSMIQNTNNEIQYSKDNKKRRLRQASFGDRNIKSSFNCDKYLPRKSLASNLNQQNLISSYNSFGLTKNSTVKSIYDTNQKQSSQTLKSLFPKTRHTNSISGLIQEGHTKDTIVENSKVNQTQKQQHLLTVPSVIQTLKEPRNVTSINQILLSKIGITSLPQVQDQQCFSPSGKKVISNQISQRKNKFDIIQQFEMKIDKNIQQEQSKPSKNSSISTTNQTIASGYQFCFSKKLKDSHITINLEEKQNKNEYGQFRTASKDRFKDCKLPASMTQQPKKKIASCTNWQNKIHGFDINNIISKIENQSIIHVTKEQQNEDSSLRSSTKLQIQKQVFSYKNLDEVPTKLSEAVTPVKSSRDLLRKCLKNPLAFFSELKSEEEIESVYKTQKNSMQNDSACHSINSPSKKKIPVQQKILQILNLNKRLVISTYMETSSQKKIKLDVTPDKEKSKKLREFQETISELMKANIKQQQVIEGNCWTKTLQTLLGIEDQGLKQSISIGMQEANALIRELKLSKLGRCGRDIGQSVIP